jgi:hypothetical protein
MLRNTSVTPEISKNFGGLIHREQRGKILRGRRFFWRVAASAFGWAVHRRPHFLEPWRALFTYGAGRAVQFDGDAARIILHLVAKSTVGDPVLSIQFFPITVESERNARARSETISCWPTSRF